MFYPILSPLYFLLTYQPPGWSTSFQNSCFFICLHLSYLFSYSYFSKVSTNRNGVMLIPHQLHSWILSHIFGDWLWVFLQPSEWEKLRVPQNWTAATQRDTNYVNWCRKAGGVNQVQVKIFFSSKHALSDGWE